VRAQARNPTALLAELQARTYHESQNKEIYVVREIREACAEEALERAPAGRG
jgi:hypothetical protein